MNIAQSVVSDEICQMTTKSLQNWCQSWCTVAGSSNNEYGQLLPQTQNIEARNDIHEPSAQNLACKGEFPFALTNRKINSALGFLVAWHNAHSLT